MDIGALTQKVADHLAGRPVKIRWEDPPASNAVGQVVKTKNGDLIVYIGYLADLKSRYKVYLHELAHCRLDYGWMPATSDHKRPAGSVKRSEAERQDWREDPREKRAQALADEWRDYAERNACKYFSGYQSAMECRLRALLDWS
jgi:hypothetical protein